MRGTAYLQCPAADAKLVLTAKASKSMFIRTSKNIQREMRTEGARERDTGMDMDIITGVLPDQTKIDKADGLLAADNIGPFMERNACQIDREGRWKKKKKEWDEVMDWSVGRWLRRMNQGG